MTRAGRQGRASSGTHAPGGQRRCARGRHLGCGGAPRDQGREPPGRGPPCWGAGAPGDSGSPESMVGDHVVLPPPPPLTSFPTHTHTPQSSGGGGHRWRRTRVGRATWPPPGLRPPVRLTGGRRAAEPRLRLTQGGSGCGSRAQHGACARWGRGATEEEGSGAGWALAGSQQDSPTERTWVWET